ncbi:PLP-dependent aminotransferase family protein [Acetobacter sacchari]|uniref:PLP-dependent aminotransferase family protein n=1 Tax=Acetobacter sacchari TaxID=2661687 RepID=A0ABS3LXC3_9PROT|nr:PLP-dependent aminotransferase family protein [Acetobacter sacchari]MBO1360574.1 PLP-dependent aminotransferase family protein [Acetobacter sacchari]
MWTPELPDGHAPLYERLVSAIDHDMRAGVLSAGERLPPQRELAFRLGVSVGSVTRAYAEAERRGLLSAHVGRGSFVRAQADPLRDVPTRERGAMIAQDRSVVDLRCNTPPPVSLVGALNAALADLAVRGVLEPALQYVQGAGLPAVREAATLWLDRQFGLQVQAGDLVQCNGGQHALALVFSSLCRPGDTVLCESSTFYGARMAAEHFGIAMRGVAMDAEGLSPEALDRAAAETRSRLLFTVPTLHNPTSRTMSVQRRKEIAEVARARDLLILEDDAYYSYSGKPPQIAQFAPERTIYLASLSKGVCPGFRLAFLVLPQLFPVERMLRGVRALGYCPPALGGLVFSQWVADGRVDAIMADVRKETSARFAMAQAALGTAMTQPGGPCSPHVWLPLSPLAAEQVAARALRSGVELTPPDASAVSQDADSGLRLCLGAPDDRTSLAMALSVVSEALVRREELACEGVV